MTVNKTNSTPPPPAFSIKSVVPTRQVSPETRQRVLESVQYNVFAFPASLVVADFLSDSGTAAMTDMQWSALMRGDESYGRNSGYYCFLEAIRDVFERGTNRRYALREILTDSYETDAFWDDTLKHEEGGFVNGGIAQLTRPNAFIVPQGRCAESLLFQATMRDIKEKQRQSQAPSDGPQPTVISNGFFDTTRANAVMAGFNLETFHRGDLTYATNPQDWQTRNPFKGNLDVAAAERYLCDEDGTRRVAMIILTITNNWGAGQPVSMANIKAVAQLSLAHNIPLIFDACRFAENAKFIKDFEEGYRDVPIESIVKEMFTFADGFTISLKKDGLANMGGMLCLRDNGKLTTKYQGIGVSIREEQIIKYGNDSYGGMSGRDLMAAAVGMYEGTKDSYLTTRLGQVKGFAQKLSDAGLPVLLPPGGSAVFLDMDEFFRDCPRPYGEFASLGLTLQLLGTYGIRCFESGPFAWEWDRMAEDDHRRAQTPNLIRFAVPRNAMTDQHFDYTVAVLCEAMDKRHEVPGVDVVHGRELSLRHFQGALKLVPVDFHASNDRERIQRIKKLEKRQVNRESGARGGLVANGEMKVTG